MLNLMKRLFKKQPLLTYQQPIELAGALNWRQLRAMRQARMQQRKRWAMFGTGAFATFALLWLGTSWANSQPAQVTMVQEFPVLNQHIRTGTTITEAHLTTRSYMPSHVAKTVARHQAEVIGLESVRPLQPGMPIPVAALRVPPELRKHQQVHIVYQTEGLRLSMPGRLLNDAAIGDMVKVMATDTRKIIDAIAKTNTIVEVY